MSELDVAAARRLYHVEKLHPAWCDWDVLGFFQVGWPHMIYSWDDHACEAIMYANGIDGTDGAAKPLPFFSTDMGACWEVIREIHERGGTLITSSSAKLAMASITPPEGEGVVANTETLTEAICTAFVALYPPIDNETAAGS